MNAAFFLVFRDFGWAFRPLRVVRRFTPSKWTRPFWGTDCRRPPKSLSLAQKASLCSASIERARKCLQAWHFVRRRHSTYSLLFRDFRGVSPEVSAAVCDPNPPRPCARYREEVFLATWLGVPAKRSEESF